MTQARCWLLGRDAPQVLAQVGVADGWETQAFSEAPALRIALSQSGAAASIRILLLCHASTRSNPQEDELRAALQASGIGFQVIFPESGDFMSPIRRSLGLEARPVRPEYSPLSCEACSDPECVHRLFRRLIY